jgi:predicted dehydrogenase
MRNKNFHRRRFLKDLSIAGIGVGLIKPLQAASANMPFQRDHTRVAPHFAVNTDIPFQAEKRIGIIGLDTSHSVAFTKSLNAAQLNPQFSGFRITAAYPKGSADIKSSVSRIPGYTEEVKKLGVEIVDSVDALLKKVDMVLLETNDGRPRLEQAMKVIAAGKPMFIDKPVAASLKDTIAIYKAAEKNSVPVFSSSSLRYMETVQDVVKGKIGPVLGADAYSPATLEPTHPDLFWYGIHGVEILFSVMGTGCEKVSRVHTDSTDIVIGVWKDGRIGTFRGTRTGKHEYGGTAYGEKGNLSLGPFNGYDNLLVQIINFFKTDESPVSARETLEIYAFMEAADESKRKGGGVIDMQRQLG